MAPMNLQQSMLLRTLVQVCGVKVADVIRDRRRYPGFAGFSRATLYRHSKKAIDGNAVVDRRTRNPGRPRSLNNHDKRMVRRQIKVLREQNGNFTSKELQEAAGLGQKCSNSTFRKTLMQMGYGYRRTAKKVKSFLRWDAN